LAFKHIKQFGTIIVFGVQADTFVPVEHNTWMNLQPTIIPTTGARSGDPIGQIQDIVALRERGWCDPAPLLTHKMGFSEVQAAYDMYEQRQDNVIKVVMDLNE
jgi:threonine dehydrogenase-like Zn-dependent dehydrogenase